MAEQLRPQRPPRGHVDRSTRILIDKIGIALSLLLGGLAVLGEFLGWWNEVGVVLSVFSLILGVLAVVDINGSRILDQLGRMEQGRGREHALLADQHSSLVENQGTMIDQQASIGAKLDAIERLLDDWLPVG